ncbi:hypothetical protein CFOL_v3_09143, partial [Cephalotus follicularis]
KGTLFEGFVTFDPGNQLIITKVLQKGDVFVFPIGLPGVITVANAVFGSNLPVANDILAKALQLYSFMGR